MACVRVLCLISTASYSQFIKIVLMEKERPVSCTN